MPQMMRFRAVDRLLLEGLVRGCEAPAEMESGSYRTAGVLQGQCTLVSQSPQRGSLPPGGWPILLRAVREPLHESAGHQCPTLDANAARGWQNYYKGGSPNVLNEYVALQMRLLRRRTGG